MGERREGGWREQYCCVKKASECFVHYCCLYKIRNSAWEEAEVYYCLTI